MASASDLATFKKNHPVHTMMEKAVAAHAQDPKTIEQIKQKTYRRPAPRSFYSKYETDMRICFGDKWTKAAQNCINTLFIANKLPSAQALGLKGKKSKSRDEKLFLCIHSTHNVLKVSPMTTGFSSPIGGNDDMHFGPLSPSPGPVRSAMEVTPFSSPPRQQRRGTRPAGGGCSIDLDQTVPYPFLTNPGPFTYEGMNFVAITFEVGDCLGNFRLQVKPSQTDADLFFEVDDRMMRATSIWCNSGIGKGSTFYESVEKYAMKKREHTTDPWEGVISIKLPFKCEFSTYDNLPDTVNHQTVERMIGRDGDNIITMKTLLFVFKECSNTFKSSREVKEGTVFNCAFSDSE